MKFFILTLLIFLTGCSKSNPVIVDTPEIAQVHPVRQHEIFIPDSLTWTAVDINGSVHFAISLDEQVQLFRFMESVGIYKKESSEMLCFYGNPTECEKIENRKKETTNDQSRVRSTSN